MYREVLVRSQRGLDRGEVVLPTVKLECGRHGNSPEIFAQFEVSGLGIREAVWLHSSQIRRGLSAKAGEIAPGGGGSRA